jgi:ATP-dependent DNA helicase RecG
MPIYGGSESITQKVLRDIVRQALAYIDDTDIIPPAIRMAEGFIPQREAIKQIHFPSNINVLQKARNRLAFEELYLIQCGLLLLKQQTKSQK